VKKNQKFNDRLQEHLKELSPQLLKAAQFISTHPYEVATRSLRYISKSATLPPPTFSRVAVALNYKNFEELRESCRIEIKSNRFFYSERAKSQQNEILSDSNHTPFIFHQSNATVSNISSLLNSIDHKKMKIVVKRLIKAKRVILLGGMSSRPFIDYMAYMASMVFDNWQVLHGETSSMTNLHLGMKDNHVAIVISKAPYSSYTINAARALNEKGVYVVGITDEHVSPLIAFCSESFVVKTETPLFFQSHAATIVLIESIMGSVVAGGGMAVRKRIASIETANKQSDIYFSTNRTPKSNT
jgi:DNA-binding MurR/RpiR family transcriptional regulator